MNEYKPDGFWNQDGLAPGFGILTWILYCAFVIVGGTFFGLNVSEFMIMLLFLGVFAFSLMWMLIIALINCCTFLAYRMRNTRSGKKKKISTPGLGAAEND
ncbi:hypothetical protein RCIP0102_00227 [Klebsiella phage RCIP0102]|uniref:Transmembrane protein n=1 Tax=Klebsiella phage RCIP0102 TaxID=3094270 RepID=A0AAX4H1G8_9VIRU